MKLEPRPLVYLAGPYTNPDPVENTNRVIHVANEMWDLYGVTPLIPHLSMLWHAVTPRPIEHWYEYDLYLLESCDAIYRLKGASTGADNEVRFAVASKIPQFYEEHDPIHFIEWISAWKETQP